MGIYATIQPLGPFFDQSGKLLVSGAVSFCEKGTDDLKTVYLDEARTIEAENPQILGSDGKMAVQIFLGLGQYTVRTYSLTTQSPIPEFPDDYALESEWDQDGAPQPSTQTNYAYTVGTMLELASCDPEVVGDTVTVLGYSSANDIVEPRTFGWSPTSVAAADGGSVVLAAGYATGRWLLKYSSGPIDVRWFGAFPGQTSDCNAAFTSAAAFASSGNSTRWLSFPKGTFQVSSGTLNLSCGLRLPPSTYFFNRSTSGEYRISVNGRFWIDGTEAYQLSSSTAPVIFDFTSNSIGAANGDSVDPRWFAGGATEALPLLGSCTLLLCDAQTVNGTTGDSEISLLKVRGGSLSFSDVHICTIKSIDAPTGTQIITGSNPVHSGVKFDGCSVRTSWISFDVLRYAAHEGNETLVVDSTMLIPVDTDISSWKSIVGDGGELRIATTKTLTVAENACVGKCFRALYSGKVSGPCGLSAQNFWTTEEVSVEGFIGSSNALSGYADMQGLSVENLYVTALEDVEIRNLKINGAIVGNSGQQVTLIGCSSQAFTASSGMKLVMQDCSIDAPDRSIACASINANNCSITIAAVNVNDFSASDSTLAITSEYSISLTLSRCTVVQLNGSSNYQAFTTEVRDCSVIGARFTVAANAIYPYSCDFFKNSFVNGYIRFYGSVGYMKSIYIVRNNFLANDLDPYYPIDIDEMTVDSGAVIRCYIADNTPAIGRIAYNALPTSGTVIRQTAQKFVYKVGTVPVGSVLARPIELRKEYQKYLFTPWLPGNQSLNFSSVSYTGLDPSSYAAADNIPSAFVYNQLYTASDGLYLILYGGHYTSGNSVSVDLDIYPH